MTESLLKYSKNIYSQAGQDGIIEKIFNTIGVKKGNFVEFGAWDGIYLSNCRKLYEEGWSGVFIEGDKKKHELLHKEEIEQFEEIKKKIGLEFSVGHLLKAE